MAGSDIYKLAEHMEKVSKRQVAKFKSAMGITAPVPSSINSKATLLKNVEKSKDKKKKEIGNNDDKSEEGDEDSPK